MSNHTHKFEAFYDENLLGGSLKQDPDLYHERSPINHIHNIKTPIIFFHGENDKVVHVSQSEKIALALKHENVYEEIYTYEGEGHGFKNEKTIEHVLEKELSFYIKMI
jgi:dipeptidyl aminopeptidase/acylaminoacyl peptidase